METQLLKRNNLFVSPLASSRNEKVSKKESSIFSYHRVQANFLFHGSDCLETSRGWIMHLSCTIRSMDLHKFDWAQVAWINPLSASLNFFARALMIGTKGTWIGSEYTSSHVLVTLLSSISSLSSFRYGKYKEFVQAAIDLGQVLAEQKIHMFMGKVTKGYQDLSWKLFTLEEA